MALLILSIVACIGGPVGGEQPTLEDEIPVGQLKGFSWKDEGPKMFVYGGKLQDYNQLLELWNAQEEEVVKLKDGSFLPIIKWNEFSWILEPDNNLYPWVYFAGAGGSPRPWDVQSGTTGEASSGMHEEDQSTLLISSVTYVTRAWNVQEGESCKPLYYEESESSGWVECVVAN